MSNKPQKYNRGQQHQGRQVVEQTIEHSPFPRPETIAKLKEVDQSLVDVLVRNIEAEQKHRHQQDAAMLAAQVSSQKLEHDIKMASFEQNKLVFARDRRQQYLAWSIIVLAIVTSFWLIMADHEIFGAGGIITVIAAFVNLFKKEQPSK